MMTYTDKISLKRESSIERVKITAPCDVYEFATKIWSDDIDLYESAMIILLNTDHTTVGWSKISQGGIANTVVDTRIVCKIAIDSLSTNVILLHNHPSGNLKPSRCDDELTKKIKQCLNLFDIRLLDHMIISKEGYYSYEEANRL